MASTTRKNSQVAGKRMKSSPRSDIDDSLTINQASRSSVKSATAIEVCVNNELRRYYDMLDGEEPSHMYRMVIRQAESALIRSVMTECRGNQTKAAEWLGISRGNLRNKLACMEDNQK